MSAAADSDLCDHLRSISKQQLLPKDHCDYLNFLKNERGFEPKVMYDIGSCVLHWTHVAEQVWPSARTICFDAFDKAAFLYGGRDFHLAVLSDVDGREVKFWQNDRAPGGNSYYRETYMNSRYFPTFRTCATQTLATAVKERGFPLPDLVKIDVQGCELDIIRGGKEIIRHARFLLVEMQHTNYNDGAPLVDVTLPEIEALGFRCIAEKFSNNYYDADYAFERIDA
jgi:FkbM family methyltransferase